MTLGIRYLTGYSASFDPATQQAEWPPHPARVFMAMAAAYFETGLIEEERTALEWLEAQPAPAIHASDAEFRSRYDVFVMVNDAAGGVANRSRQARQFSKCRPHSDTVYLSWESEAPAGVASALESLCSKVTRIGHSSSLVQMWVEDQLPANAPNAWRPTESEQDRWMRTTEGGLLGYLEHQFNGEGLSEYFALSEKLESSVGDEKKELQAKLAERFPSGRPYSARPIIPSWNGYRSPHSHQAVPVRAAQGPFDSAIIILPKIEGSNLGLASTLQLTGALRSAVMKHGPQPPPEWACGHTEDGRPSVFPHLAFFPLPFVEADHADGHVMGLAIAIPRSLAGVPDEDRDLALRKQLGRLLFDPNTGQPASIELCHKDHHSRRDIWRWKLALGEAHAQTAVTLNSNTWAGASRAWASVTPVVLHHYPKRGANDVERILREAFVSAGLPEPSRLCVMPVSHFKGAGHATEVPPYAEGGAQLCRYQTHLYVEFDREVAGPLLVGRGRFRGYGLLRPIGGKRSR